MLPASPSPRLPPSGSWTPGARSRTIRVVWFGAEEVGLFGGLDYRAKHGKEPHYAIVESDFGADRVWKVDSKLGKTAKRKPRPSARPLLAPLGHSPGLVRRGGRLRHRADADRRTRRG